MDENYNNPYFNLNWKPLGTGFSPNFNPQIQGPYGDVSRFGDTSKYGNINGYSYPKIQFNSDNQDVKAPTTKTPTQTGPNPYMAGIQGAIGLMDLGVDAASMGNEAKSIQTNAPSEQTDAFGKPVYNLGEYSGYINNIKPRGASGGEVAGGIGKGAMSGASIGSAIMPGIGTAIGAIGGAVIGGLSKVIGGARRKRKMRDQKKRAYKSLAARQNNYNTGMAGFNQQRQAMQSYYDQLNNTNRMYNLYGS